MEQLTFDFSAPVKRCSKCGEVKPLTEFVKDNSSKDGLRNYCKKCVSMYHRIRIQSDPEYSARRKAYARTPEVRARMRDRRNTDRYRSDRRAKNRIYSRGKRISDTQFRLAGDIRSRINKALTRNKKSASTFELLGCTKAELMLHLERQFKPGMEWNNQGPVWHHDHILPCAAFDLTDPEQQRACFHFANLRPEFASANMSKQDTIDFTLVSKRWFTLFPGAFNRLASANVRT